MTNAINNPPQHIVHQIDNHGQNVVNTLDTVFNNIFFLDHVKGFADAMKNFNILPVKQPAMDESSLKFTLIKIRNTITDYHSFIIRESARKSGQVEKKVYTVVKCIFYPFKLFKTTDALREIIATKIAFAVRFIALACIQAVGHSFPYLTISTLITAGMYIYTLNPLALTGIFTGTLLAIQLYVLHLLVEGVKQVNKNVPEAIDRSAENIINGFSAKTLVLNTFTNAKDLTIYLSAPVIRLTGRVFASIIDRLPYYGSANKKV